MNMTTPELEKEFDRQVDNLLHKKYYSQVGLSEDKFLDLLNPLRNVLNTVSVDSPDLEKGFVPFVIVIKSTLLPTKKAMELVEREGKKGITKLFPLQPEDFKVISDITIPENDAYLLIEIDRGKETINLPPNKAFEIIKEKNRMPLTIDEGIALVTHFPDFLIKNNCFSLLASRTGKDQRVPAIWINAQKEPNLGWCWDGNPHTWLGSASCNTRLD